MENKLYKGYLSKLEKLFNQKQEIAAENAKIGKAFDEEMKQCFWYTYSDCDADILIDSLDYGIRNVSFDEFITEMKAGVPEK